MRLLLPSMLFVLAGVFLASVQAGQTARLDLAAEEISALAIEGEQVWLRLTPAAADRVQAITQQHLGDLLELTVVGHPALKVRIRATWTSGVILLGAPSPALRQELLTLQDQLTQDGSPQ